MPPATATALCWFLSLIGLVGMASADSATIHPTADTALFELDGSRDHNFGAEPEIPVGTIGPTGGAARARALFRFDIETSLPPGATVTAATFRVRAVMTPSSEGSRLFSLNRSLVPWIEGRGLGGLPGGSQALAGEPTWNNRAHPSSPWASPGGAHEDGLADEPSATATFPASGTPPVTVSFTFNPQGIAAVQDMLDSPAQNFGWFLFDLVEDSNKSARRIATREHATHPPELEITFTPPAPPPTPSILSITFAPPDLDIVFVASSGIAYRLEENSGLTAGLWSPLQSLDPAPDDSPRTFTVPNPPPGHQFYRIVASFPP
ncbi:hypothetical protein BH23VER1_BH23VER1_18470 [soil metagenome]